MAKSRIAQFVDNFIRSEYVANLTADRDSDFMRDTDRANRCYEAAESGSDGKTHAEVIADWRDAFENMLRDRRGHEYPDRFAVAVNAYFDSVEDYHYTHGTLFQQIG